jgi:hypothetical protein
MVFFSDDPNAGGSVQATVAGEITLTGATTVFETGLASIMGVGLTLKYASWTTTLSYDTSGSTLTIYAWKPGATEPTQLVPAASASETVSYVVHGTR